MTAEDKKKTLQDVSGAAINLDEKGKHKRIHRKQNPSDYEEKTYETPIVRVPDSLRDKPIRVWTD